MKINSLVQNKVQMGGGGGILRLIINLNGFSCAVKWIE